MAALQRITRQLSDERASVLAKKAVELSQTGQQDAASRTLREAAALTHDNIDVQAAFLAIHQHQLTSPLQDLCRRYALYHDQKAGDEAVKFLRSSEVANLGSEALECLQIVLENGPTSLSKSQDSIVAEFARQSYAVRQYFASELTSSTTEFFDNIYDRGDESANCLRSIVLDPSLWAEEEIRLRVEDDLFQLFLAKLMESGHDHDGRALKGIALLLIADTQRLHTFVDEDAFDALLTSLDFRWSPDVRGQATLVISKLMEVSPQPSSEYFNKFVTARVVKQKADDLIVAFSAAANLFPVMTPTVSQLFLTENFLSTTMPLLEQKFNTTLVHDTFIALLNAACIDGACRAAVAKNCSAWLSHKVSNGVGKQCSMAATVLAKLRASGTKVGEQKANRADDDVSTLVDLFKTTLKTEESRDISDSLEGLAYTSLKPEIKEQLAHDPAFLKSLFRALDANTTIPEIVIGGLSIIANLTNFQPNLSEEQKRISQLKAYANASKPAAISELENDNHVRARCSALVEAGVMPTLTKLNKISSIATLQLTDKILLSLSKNSKDRGKIAQQGAVKLLIIHIQRLKQRKDVTAHVDFDASHALARILISLDPSLIFPASSMPHITDAIPPLAKLLKPTSNAGLSDQPRDLLPVFESLLALTNLASSPDGTAANLIIKLTWTDVEDLLLGNNDMLRRAACELICNLTALPQGVGKFVDGSKRAKQRLHILLALADVEDVATRRASGGAIAMLTEHDVAISAMLELERAPEILLTLCGDDDAAVRHRGLAATRNIVCAEGDVGQRSRQRFKENGATEKLKEALRTTKDQQLLQLGVDALKALMR